MQEEKEGIEERERERGPRRKGGGERRGIPKELKKDLRKDRLKRGKERKTPKI